MHFQLIIFIILISIFSSCGFKLRGSQPISSQMKNLFIITEHPQDQFILQLIKNLKENGVDASLSQNHSIVKLNNKPDQQLKHYNHSQTNINKSYKKHQHHNHPNLGHSILEVNLPIIEEQNYSYDARGKCRHFRIVVKVNYKLLDANYNMLGGNSVTVSRIYARTSNQLLSDNNEKNIILNELNLELLHELITSILS
jgi:outer membrane lipopolysaccharide assembly protein LptE/RlpB